MCSAVRREELREWVEEREGAILIKTPNEDRKERQRRGHPKQLESQSVALPRRRTTKVSAV